MLSPVALVRTDVSEELSASETSVLTRVTRRNIPEDAILRSHRSENLKSYNLETVLVYIKQMFKVICWGRRNILVQ
jgi:hypothetical protein